MTKFNPEQWRKIKAETWAVAPRRLRLNLVDRAALWVKDGSTETLVGYSDSHDVELPHSGFKFKIMVDGYVFDPVHSVVKSSEPSLTNFEKRAEMSPAEILVTQALRRLNAKQKAFEKQQREASIQAEIQRGAREPEPEPVGEPEPVQDAASQEEVIPESAPAAE